MCLAASMIVDRPNNEHLIQQFRETDIALQRLESAVVRKDEPAPESVVADTVSLVRELLAAYIRIDSRKANMDSEQDLLIVFRNLVRGDPAWNAIRDNCRELVYYQNCIRMQRQDALPAAPGKMAVRTARHVFLYVKSRCIRDRLIDK
jgi:hypothetical protein